MWINGDGAGPGMPEKYFYTDNGREFVNETMLDLLDAHDIHLKTTAAYTPNQNGLNERNHGLADIVVTALMEDDPKLTMQEAVNQAAFVKNSKITDTGFSPFQLVYGRNPRIPGTVDDNHPISLEVGTRSEIARTMIQRTEAARKKFLEKETDKRLKLAAAQRVTFRDDHSYKSGEVVWFRDTKDQERRKGTVIGRDGTNWWIKWNNHLRPVASYDMWKIKEERHTTGQDQPEVETEGDPDGQNLEESSETESTNPDGPDPAGTEGEEHAPAETPELGNQEPQEEEQQQNVEPPQNSEEGATDNDDEEEEGEHPDGKQARKERRERNVMMNKTEAQPARFANVRMTNSEGETFSGSVVKKLVHAGEEIVWIRLHEGNTLEPIAWNKLRTWSYMTDKETEQRKAVLTRWAEYENDQRHMHRRQPQTNNTRQERQNPARDAHELRWKRYEERSRKRQQEGAEEQRGHTWSAATSSQPVRASTRWKI